MQLPPSSTHRTAVSRVLSTLALLALVAAPTFALERNERREDSRLERRDHESERERDLERESESDFEREHESERERERERERESELEGGVAVDGDEIDVRLPAPRPESPEVHAGGRVAIRWRRIEPRVEEFELILSLDGGRTWSMRISPEFHQGKDEYVWRVPNLAVAEARIRIRANVDGHEVWGPESPSFRMLSNPRKPREGWLFWETQRWDQTSGEPDVGSRLFVPYGESSLRADEPSTPIESPVRTMAPPTTLEPWSAPPAESCRSSAAEKSIEVFHDRVCPLRE